MDTRLLKMFCAVAESASLVKASTRLNLTPSAISHGIKSLETQLGCRLFERTAKKMLLNQAGEQLLAAVRSPLDALDAASESLKQLGKWGRTRFRVGATDSICHYLLPKVFRDLKQAHPQVELQVESGSTADLLESLQENKLDLVIGVAPGNHITFQMRPLFRDELMLMFSPSHPWAEGRPIARDDLRVQPMILGKRGSYTSQKVQEFFQGLDLVPNTLIEIENVGSTKEMVRLGLGATILAPWVADRELSSGALCARPLGPKPLSRRWVAFSLPGRRLSLAEEEFCRLCRRQATALRVDRKDVRTNFPRQGANPPRSGAPASGHAIRGGRGD